jgi:hypothetical protein
LEETFFPVSVQKGPFRILQKRIRKLRKKLEVRVQLLSQVVEGEATFRELSKKTGLTPYKLKKALEAASNVKNTLESSVRHRCELSSLRSWLTKFSWTGGRQFRPLRPSKLSSGTSNLKPITLARRSAASFT